MITRGLSALLEASHKTVLLLGPRQTGKSTLMRALRPHLTFNLANEAVFLDFASNPRELEERLGPVRLNPRGITSVLIDEVQRLPSLLNTVQALLDEHPKRYRFLLTGSSARKLRRGGANLLPGRVHAYALGALSARELDYDVKLSQVLSTGLLPGVFSSDSESERRKTLSTYAATYLREEIQAEALTRSLEGFARFIQVTAEYSGKFLDVAKLATAAQAARQSVTRWLEVLEDTLLVRRISSFAKSATRRLVQHPKLFYFDVGVINGLLGNFGVSADRMGLLFEHLVAQQLFDGAAALDLSIRVSTFRTEHGAEVDFIVEHSGETWAVEIKASRSVSPADLRGLKSFADFYGKKHRSAVWYWGAHRRRIDGVDVLPWQEGLKDMNL